MELALDTDSTACLRACSLGQLKALMLTKESADIIRTAANENRLLYKDLTIDEQRTLVAELLLKSEQDLVDGDYGLDIQAAAANIIRKNASLQSLMQFKEVLEAAFIKGTKQYEAYYVEEIETLLNAEWDDNHRMPNEHFENDAMQRIRDIQDTQRRMNGF